MAIVLLLLLVASVPLSSYGRSYDTDREYHPAREADFPAAKNLDIRELSKEYWVSEAQAALQARIRGPDQAARVARNVIMFLGDGMSVPTLAAARALLGQQAGRTGEEAQLAFETFPVTGLAKTYCVNDQVADSACTATAYLCGIKNNYGTIGVDASVARRDCAASTDNATHAASIAAWALLDGRDAGVVTTTRITHASPAGAYARVANRNWENDAEVLADGADPALCPDIAHQLVHEFPGKQFKVILGGGLRNFRAIGDGAGRRPDGRNLTREWEEDKISRGASHSFVTNAQELLGVDVNNTDYLMGLFANNHMPYHLEADPDSDPTLEQLTEIAIRMLSKSEKGYFLFVEGGRIDHGHHDNFVHLALDETLELSKAVETALSLTSADDTLLLVTADHSHVMAYSGYSQRGRDVLAASRSNDEHGVPYMTLSYANGPGFRSHTTAGRRPDVTQDNSFGGLRWRSHVDAYRSSESHGGDDVAVFALGPQQQMFTGLYEQSQLPHLMGYAACIGPGQHAAACDDAAPRTSSAVAALTTAALVAFIRHLRFLQL